MIDYGVLANVNHTNFAQISTALKNKLQDTSIELEDECRKIQLLQQCLLLREFSFKSVNDYISLKLEDELMADSNETIKEQTMRIYQMNNIDIFTLVKNKLKQGFAIESCTLVKSDMGVDTVNSLTAVNMRYPYKPNVEVEYSLSSGSMDHHDHHEAHHVGDPISEHNKPGGENFVTATIKIRATISFIEKLRYFARNYLSDRNSVEKNAFTALLDFSMMLQNEDKIAETFNLIFVESLHTSIASMRNQSSVVRTL